MVNAIPHRSETLQRDRKELHFTVDFPYRDPFKESFRRIEILPYRRTVDNFINAAIGYYNEQEEYSKYYMLKHGQESSHNPDFGVVVRFAKLEKEHARKLREHQSTMTNLMPDVESVLRNVEQTSKESPESVNPKLLYLMRHIVSETKPILMQKAELLSAA